MNINEYDYRGRPIGYDVLATCDHPGCEIIIDRGLAYACGNEHGFRSSMSKHMGCDQYFCENHSRRVLVDYDLGNYCFSCAELIESTYKDTFVYAHHKLKKQVKDFCQKFKILIEETRK